jgi:hypothetical protein
MGIFFGHPAPSSQFSAAYIKALQRMPQAELLRLLNGGLVKRTFEALRSPNKRGEFVMPENVFVFQLAEKLCDAALLPFDETGLTHDVCTLMNSSEWGQMADRVIATRFFMTDDIAQSTRNV